MNLRKSFISCLALGTIAGTLSTGADATNQPHVALLMPTQSVEYWALYIKGFRKEAEAQGLKLDV